MDGDREPEGQGKAPEPKTRSYEKLRPAPPDHPIFKAPLRIFTLGFARPRPEPAADEADK